MVNQRKKHFAEERAKVKRKIPDSVIVKNLYVKNKNYLKNQGTWKLSQLKKLKFEEIKEEFDKLVQQIDTFVPINLEATKAKLKRYGDGSEQRTSKKQRVHKKIQKSDKEESVEAMNPTPLTTQIDKVCELNKPEDAYDRVLWSDLMTMIDPPLNEDAIWSLPFQQKMYCTKALATPEQTTTGKENSNPLIADSLLKTIRLSMHLVTTMKH
ncbi:hypothetical protein Tco_0963959 [Tanacetum coccineum]